MWSRRRFLETASGLPLIGGLFGAAAVPAAPVAAMATPDYFRDPRHPSFHQRLWHLHGNDGIADAA